MLLMGPSLGVIARVCGEFGCEAKLMVGGLLEFRKDLGAYGKKLVLGMQLTPLAVVDPEGFEAELREALATTLEAARRELSDAGNGGGKR